MVSFTSVLVIAPRILAILAAPSGRHQTPEIQSTPAYELSDAEFDAYMKSETQSGRSTALSRLYDDGKSELSKIQKRSSASYRACSSRDQSKDTPHGRVPTLIHHWIQAQCVEPHKKPDFKITCGAYRINPDGRKVQVAHVDYDAKCAKDEFCFDNDKEKNGVGDYDANGIPDVGCAKISEQKVLKAVSVQTNRYSPVKACSDPVRPLDPAFASKQRGPKRPMPRRFLLNAEATCSDDKQCAALELFIEEHAPDYEKPVAQGRDVQNVHTMVETYDMLDPRYWKFCILAGASLAAYNLFLRFVVLEEDRLNWVRALDYAGPSNRSDPVSALARRPLGEYFDYTSMSTADPMG